MHFKEGSFHKKKQNYSMLACTYMQHLHGINNNTALMHACILKLRIMFVQNSVENVKVIHLCHYYYGSLIFRNLSG